MIADRPDDRDDAPAPAVLTRRHMLGAGTAAAATGLLRLPPPAHDGLPRSAPAPHTKVLRTPEYRFRDLADYPFEPHYVHVDAGDGTGGRLRMHYVDERPAGAVKPSGQTILLLHGQPSWSYLYRHVIPPLVAAGHRCVAPDLVGFGRSDKPASRFAYTYQRHVDWLREALFDRLGLRDVTMVCHDWGGLHRRPGLRRPLSRPVVARAHSGRPRPTAHHHHRRGSLRPGRPGPPARRDRQRLRRVDAVGPVTTPHRQAPANRRTTTTPATQQRNHNLVWSPACRSATSRPCPGKRRPAESPRSTPSPWPTSARPRS
ncbi:alpha/beta fold hydrolase [Microbispora sp. NPDC088329]|uniref:alpha/beta fold hydrolase n=1 Tax=Microbispora sp. NPDC088329 TaxID=3154869 RepID=UPI00343F46A5